MSENFLRQLRTDGVVRGKAATLTPLVGGVSSDIYLVQDGDRQFVVKRALEKLKVKADWYADTSRNKTEHDYIQYVAETNPACVPEVIASGDGYFAMEYLGDGFTNWKQAMLDGRFEKDWARMAGAFLGEIHCRSKAHPEIGRRFDRMDAFWELRIEPYLVATGSRHPDLEMHFQKEAHRLKLQRSALVHGDFSPKNMLVSGDRLVVLDCEVACYADPAFDVAFLFTHLLLKTLCHKNYCSEVGHMIRAFISSYGGMNQEMDLRTSRLLLLLLLARIDGKSPVEYLTDDPSKALVRDFVRKQLSFGNIEIQELEEKWFAEVTALAE